MRRTTAAGLAALLALAGAGGGVGALLPRAVEGAWVQEAEVDGGFAAAVVPAAVLSGCTYESGVLGLGAYVEITWSAPAGVSLSDAVLRASTAGPGSPMTELSGFSLQDSTVSSSGGYATTVYTSSLVGRTGTSGTADVAISVRQAGWESVPVAVRVDLGLLSLGAGCRILP